MLIPLGYGLFGFGETGEKEGGGGPKSSDLRCREYWIPGSDGYNDRYLIRSNPPPSEVQSLDDRIFCDVSG
jgi:hypothetical protein